MLHLFAETSEALGSLFDLGRRDERAFALLPLEQALSGQTIDRLLDHKLTHAILLAKLFLGWNLVARLPLAVLNLAPQD